ncbi:MAG: VCBS repeat-containing protein [Anaerolineaceae bacterium]|nr:VCBS repeat-containing protein [Anaerolineaceae bacterium]
MFYYKHHIIDTSLPEGLYAQSMLGDFNNDGHLEYVLGLQYGDLFLYQQKNASNWQRFVIGKASPSDVGAIALDVDGDGWLDIVTGGAWYRNSRDFRVPFERIPFDPTLHGVHDVFAADLDGCGEPEIITMSDQNDLRFYKIPEDPEQIWTHTRIGSAVHAGIAIGDLNGNSYLDVVRTNVWFENVKGDGSEWVEHPLPFPPQEQSRLTEPFMVNATHAFVCDMNKNEKNDIVMVENEMTGGKLFWLENLNGDAQVWKIHYIAIPESPIRGAYHSLVVRDFNGSGGLDIFSCEMEAIGGDEPPQYYIWENLDQKGGAWREHCILDVNLGGHAALMDDISGNGLPDIITKPWRPMETNALHGKPFVIYLENLGEPH